MKEYIQIVNESLPEGARLLMLSMRGSHAHGTFMPSTDPASVDDIDLMGIVVMEEGYYLGLRSEKQVTFEVKVGELDIVVYELRKFLGMASKSNPNILPMLWINPVHCLYSTPTWARIVKQRELFSSQLALNTFIGYAHGQMTQAQTGVAFKGHGGEKRRVLFDKLGYDAKSAAHTIRLLRMAKEFVATGVMTVDRTGLDAKELMAIKRGEVGTEKFPGGNIAFGNSLAVSVPVKMILEEMERLVREIESSPTPLPVRPDFPALEQLCVEVLKQELGLERER